jgi:hypothetical protein
MANRHRKMRQPMSVMQVIYNVAVVLFFGLAASHAVDLCRRTFAGVGSTVPPDWTSAREAMFRRLQYAVGFFGAVASVLSLVMYLKYRHPVVDGRLLAEGAALRLTLLALVTAVWINAIRPRDWSSVRRPGASLIAALLLAVAVIVLWLLWSVSVLHD